MKLRCIATCYKYSYMKKDNVVGEKIRKLRLEDELTQEELALKSGLSQGYINQLENGRRNYTQKTLELIAQALSVPIITFFEENAESINTSDQKTLVAENQRKRLEYKKEVNSLLKGMPECIIEHYIILMKLEKKLLERRDNNPPENVPTHGTSL